MCGGPSQQQNDLSNEEADFYRTQVQAYNTAYQNFSTIQDTLNQQFAPVIAKGPGQRGFTDQERNDLMTKAREGTATEFSKAQQAVNSNFASRGGGNDVTNITSGAAGQTESDLAAYAANSEADTEMGINEADYSLGKTEYDQAIQGEEGLAAGWNPNTWSGSVNQSAKTANDEANEITKEKESVWGNVLGGLSGVAGGWAEGGFKLPK